MGENPHSILTKAARLQLFGKSPVGVYLRLNRRLWQHLPVRARNSNLIRVYGGWLQGLLRLHATRQQYFGTFFLRNRPALELMRRLADKNTAGSTLKIAVLACSIGAEVYSILWTIRSARPDLGVEVCALDISKEILSVAENGVYTPGMSDLVSSPIFERLTTQEMAEMFDWEGNQARVKPWLREGITWRIGDASDPELVRVIGLHDMVVASNFLCHMQPHAAENCLHNISRLVKRGGYLFVSGVDLEVRARVARELGWRPIPELIEQIHDGDPPMRRDWPWTWWGLEPINHKRDDWQIRYAVAFRLNAIDE